MTTLRRFLIFAVFPVSLVFAAFTLGCGGSPESGDTDRSDTDSGMFFDNDTGGGESDSGVGGTARAFPLTPSNPSAIPRCPECEAGCAEPVCCVGNADCCYPIDSPPLTETPLTCGGRCDAFGDQDPMFDGDVLIPNGNLEGESGIAFGEPIDSASQRTELVFAFRAPVGCGDNCVESATVGFVDGEAALEGARPLVAVTAIGQTERAQIVVAGEVVKETELRGSFRMTLRPDRTVTIERDGDLVHQSIVADVRSLRLVVSGRNENPDVEDTPLGIASLQVNLRVCDMPANWSTAEALRIIEDGVVASAIYDDPQDVSAVMFVSRVHLAFVQDGEVVLAREDVSGELNYNVIGRLAGDEPFRQPALLTDGTRIAMFVERLDEGGEWKLERYMFDGDDFVAAQPVEVEQAVTDVAVTRVGTYWLMVGRHRGAVRTYVSEDGLRFEDLDNEVAPSGASATVTISGSTYQLMLERQVGSRSVFSFFASNDFASWSSVEPRAFAAGGQVANIDIHDPALVTTVSSQALFFVGTSGVNHSLARATRALTPGLVTP